MGGATGRNIAECFPGFVWAEVVCEGPMGLRGAGVESPALIRPAHRVTSSVGLNALYPSELTYRPSPGVICWLEITIREAVCRELLRRAVHDFDRE